MERVILALATLLLAVIGLLPVAAMLKESVTADGGFSLDGYRALLRSEGQPARLMAHSLALSLLTASVSTPVGVALGALLGKTDLRLRGSLTLLFTVPLLLPPYVLAVAWFSILSRTGLLGAVLPDSWSQKISLEFFGLPGCAFVLATAFTPIAMLLTIAFLQTVNPRLEYAGRLVSGWSSILLRITLPLMVPAISFAAVIIFLLSIGEISVPMYLRFPVYPVETLTQFAAFYDFRAANVAASPLFLLTLIILGLQTGLHKRVLQLGRRTPSAEMALIALGRWQGPALALLLALAIVLIVLPIGALVLQSHSLETYEAALARAGESVLRSVTFAAIAATLLTVFGFFWGYLAERRTLSIWWVNEWLALLLLALPGSVVGIGLIGLWNHPATNFIYAKSCHPHSRLSRAICGAANACRIGFHCRHSAVIGGSGMAERRGMARDTAAYRGTARRPWASCRLADQLRVLCARRRDQHRGLSSGLRHASCSNPHAHGQWRAESHFGALHHSHGNHDSAARCHRPMGQVRSEPPVSKIKFRCVTKLYRDRRVVDALSLVIELGERVVLFGPSGCGKSTTLLLVAGLVAPDSGEIRIDGKVVSSARKILIPPQSRSVGMVFQDLALWPHMSVAGNIAFGLRACRVPAVERDRRIHGVANLVGLGDHLNVRPGELSGGEQQRVALARALALEPRILLMDEPLSNLDAALARRLSQEILRLHAELAFTLVYVTHSRAEAQEIGMRTIELGKTGAR